MNHLPSCRRFGLTCFAAVVFGLGIPLVAAGQSAPAPATVEGEPHPRPVPVRLSPGAADIVRMTDAKVAPEVVKVYVETAPAGFNLTAGDIIALKEHGVSNELLTSLLQHRDNPQRQLLQSPAGWSNFYPPPPEPPPGYEEELTGEFPPPRRCSNCGSPASFAAAIPLGPVISFNNSFPTYVNGSPVYSGYYLPAWFARW